MCFRPPEMDVEGAKCPLCGAKVAIGALECPNCGAKAETAPPAVPSMKGVSVPGKGGIKAPGDPKVPKPPSAPGAPKAPGA